MNLQIKSFEGGVHAYGVLSRNKKFTYGKQHLYRYRENGDGYGEAKAEEQHHKGLQSWRWNLQLDTAKNQKNIKTNKLLVQNNKHLYFSTVVRSLCTSKWSEEEQLQEWRLRDAHCPITKNFWGGSSIWAAKCCPQRDHPVPRQRAAVRAGSCWTRFPTAINYWLEKKLWNITR